MILVKGEMQNEIESILDSISGLFMVCLFSQLFILKKFVLPAITV